MTKLKINSKTLEKLFLALDEIIDLTDTAAQLLIFTRGIDSNYTTIEEML